MDTPVRKYQKQKDYQRHKLFRKMKRRRKAAIEQAKDAPMKPLRRKFKIPKFEGGKDDKPNVFQLPDGTFVNSHNEPLDVLDYAGVEDPTKWTYVDKKGNRYTPKATRTLTKGELFTQRQIENEQNTRPFEFTPYIEGANEGAAAASLMMGFPFNMAGSAYYTAKASRDAYDRNYLGGVLNGLGAVTPAGSGIYDRIKLAIENYRQPLKKLESPVIRTVQDNGKIRLSLPTHTDSNPRQFVLEPQGDNKFYVHMRTWDGDHVPANLSNEDKQTLFQALYDELPDGAEILFPKSGPGYYGTRGTVAGLQRLARDFRFTPGTKGTLQYLDKDGKTVKTYEGTSFIKTPRITAENAANITPETIRLYHGSPVRFNTFSANFIGSGEGGSKVMRGINLWPEEKIGNAPKLANIKSPDAPMHLGVSSTPLGGELNPTVYDVLGKDLNLYKAAPREVKSLKQEDLVKQGYDGVQTPNQVTVFPESIHKLSIDKQSSIEDFVMSHPEVERWTPWTTDMQKMQNIIDMSRMSKYTPEQWTAAQDMAIRRGDMAEAQRLRDLHFRAKATNTKAINADGSPTRTYHTVADEYDPSFTEFNPDIEGTHSAIYTGDDPFMSGTYASKIVSEAERDHIIESTRLRELAKYSKYKDDKTNKKLSDLYKVYTDKKKARKQILADHPWLSNEAQKERQKQLYVNLQNPVTINNNGSGWNHINLSDLPEDVWKNMKVDIRNGYLSDSYSTRSLEAAQMATGNYDGSIVSNVLDYGGRKGYLSEFKPGTVYQVNNPENLKSADAVTYADDGTRIPLGSRDNFNVNDIRYGLLAPLAGGTALLGYNSLGQPVDTYKHGKDSGIHINPKNRGKFNALKKRTGKTTEQLTHSKNPLTRKRAIFALNSKKWKH